MFTDYKTRKDRMTKKKVKRSTQKTIVERWYTGKIYLHIPFLPFKLRIK